jgi:hypothetical protein
VADSGPGPGVDTLVRPLAVLVGRVFENLLKVPVPDVRDFPFHLDCEVVAGSAELSLGRRVGFAGVDDDGGGVGGKLAPELAQRDVQQVRVAGRPRAAGPGVLWVLFRLAGEDGPGDREAEW